VSLVRSGPVRYGGVRSADPDVDREAADVVVGE
jgi:hypothetical protein